MITKSSLRNEYGKGFCTAVDKYIIAWRPLSIEDFFYYDDLQNNSDIAVAVLEDEIFKKCITDKNILDAVGRLPAGIISSVVQNIMEHSGPLSVDHFNDLLDQKRQQATEPIHHLVPLIIRAFPGYTPEDVYAMPFDTFMLRLAQAESLLMLLNVITEPIRLTDGTPEPEQKKVKHIPAELKAIFDKQQQKMPAKPTDKTGVKFDTVDMSAEKSPILNKNPKHPAYKPIPDLNKDRIANEQAAGSEDESAERAKMVKDAQQIYAPLIKKLPYYTKK